MYSVFIIRWLTGRECLQAMMFSLSDSWLIFFFSLFLINLPVSESVGCAIWLFSRELVSTWSWVLLRFSGSFFFFDPRLIFLQPVSWYLMVLHLQLAKIWGDDRHTIDTLLVQMAYAVTFGPLVRSVGDYQLLIIPVNIICIVLDISLLELVSAQLKPALRAPTKET